jgi:hypothetical protein
MRTRIWAVLIGLTLVAMTAVPGFAQKGANQHVDGLSARRQPAPRRCPARRQVTCRTCVPLRTILRKEALDSVLGAT